MREFRSAKALGLLLVILGSCTGRLHAHVGPHPSVHDTVSLSGTKMYAQEKHDYTEVGMTNVSTYQVLDIQISGNRLVYRAYDIDGKLRDELVIEK